MKYRIIATIKNINEEKAFAMIEVKHDTDCLVTSEVMSTLYEAIIKNMKDTNEKAFYDAMTSFIHEELNNEN